MAYIDFDRPRRHYYLHHKKSGHIIGTIKTTAVPAAGTHTAARTAQLSAKNLPIIRHMSAQPTAGRARANEWPRRYCLLYAQGPTLNNHVASRNPPGNKHGKQSVLPICEDRSWFFPTLGCTRKAIISVPRVRSTITVALLLERSVSSGQGLHPVLSVQHSIDTVV